jgi:hypothetical protein
MNIRRVLYSIGAMAFGVFMVVYGEYDDSPGGQFLGLISFVAGVFGLVKSRKKKDPA